MCPHCGEPLVVYELEGIEIDHCVECGGTWLDAGELELIAEFSEVESGELSNALYSPKKQQHIDRRCPRCNKKMNSIHIGQQENIEAETCPYGHGLWLDKGELRAIINSYSQGEEGSVARFFGNLYQDELKSNSNS